MNKKLIISMLFALLFSASAGVSYAQKKTSNNKSTFKDGMYTGNLIIPEQKGLNGTPVILFATRNYIFEDGFCAYQNCAVAYSINIYTSEFESCMMNIPSDAKKLSMRKKDGAIYLWENDEPENEEDYFDILTIENGHLHSNTINSPFYYLGKEIELKKMKPTEMQTLERALFYTLSLPTSFPQPTAAKIAEAERQKRIQDSIQAENMRIQDSIREVQRRIEQQRIDSINRAEKLLKEYEPYRVLFNTKSEFELCILGDSRQKKLHSIIDNKMDAISIRVVKGKELLKHEYLYYAFDLKTICQLYDKTNDSYIDKKLKDFIVSRKKLDKTYNRKAKGLSHSIFLQHYMNGKYTNTGKVIGSILGITAGTAAIAGIVILLKNMK